MQLEVESLCGKQTAFSRTIMRSQLAGKRRVRGWQYGKCPECTCVINEALGRLNLKGPGFKTDLSPINIMIVCLLSQPLAI
jgi:hypothetical protein